MKTKTAKIVMTACILALFLFLTTAFNKPPADVNKYLTMRIFEAPMGAGSKVMIVYEDGKTEELDLDKYKAENMLPNMVKLNQAINMVGKKGYELVSSNGGEYSSIYTFIKK